MITMTRSDRVCPECGGSGLINMGPTYRGGPNVHERCDCQPVQVESEREYYARRAREANEEADHLMALREAQRADTPALAAE